MNYIKSYEFKYRNTKNKTKLNYYFNIFNEFSIKKEI